MAGCSKCPRAPPFLAWRSASGPGSRAPRWPAASTGASWTCACRSTPTPRIEIVTAQRPAGRQRDPALGRARDGRRREASLSRGADRRRAHRPRGEVPVRLPGRAPFTPDDLARIEDEMRRIVAENASFERRVVSRAEAKALFESMGETLKVARLADIPEGDDITLFAHGGFVDLCRGPHVQRADQIGAVKLLDAAGAYWKGDESNPMLQRIYGTAFASKKELDEHLARHRRGEAPRPSPPRRRTRSLPHRTARAGLAVLPPEGDGALQRPRRLHAQPVSQVRLPGGDDAAALPRGALQDLGPLLRVPRRHVLVRRRRGRGAGREGDELPGPLPALSVGEALVPRPADPLRRVLAPAPQRAQRHAHRPLARARDGAGRRPHLLRARRTCPPRSSASSR